MPIDSVGLSDIYLPLKLGAVKKPERLSMPPMRLDFDSLVQIMKTDTCKA